MGGTGTLGLDTELTTIAAVNTARWIVQFSSGQGSGALTLDSSFSLDGVTHLLTQSGTWSVTNARDSVVAFAGSHTVMYDTGLGDWLVTLNPFSMSTTSPGTFFTNVSATFVPVPQQVVPEPSALLLFGTGAAAMVVAVRRRRKQQVQ